jgi:hypothetical protein
MKLTVAAFLIIAALTSGCAPAPQKMTANDRKVIRVVSINGNIPKPPEPFYLGPGSGPGMMFGALGAIVTEPGRQSARDSLRDFLQANDVSIERIVFEEFSTALRRSGKLLVADKPEPGAATINVVIKLYGLSIPNGFSSNLVPILSVECTMLDASGKTVWSASDRVLTLGNPVEGQPGEAMRNDAKAIEASLRAAAKHISTNVVNEL